MQNHQRRSWMFALAVAPFLMCATGVSGAAKFGALYQWVDDDGRVVYGDSPRSISDSRRVGEEGTSPVSRAQDRPQQGNRRLPVANAESIESDPVRGKSAAELQRVLAELNAAMAQMRQMTLETAQLRAKARRAQPQVAEQLPGSSAHSGPPLADESVSTPTVRGGRADFETVGLSSASQGGVLGAPVAELGELEQVLALEPPVLEVARAVPQPIETRMTDKERAKSRWRTENQSDLRFLSRAVKRAE